MHRKFIALILATAMAVTGISALPARADPDTNRLIAGIAALALIGVAIQKSRKRDVAVANPIPRPRPQHTRVSRFDLPGQCLRNRSVNGRPRSLFGPGCLRKNYAFNEALPDICRFTYWTENRKRAGYDPRCLRERGYRFARH